MNTINRTELIEAIEKRFPDETHDIFSAIAMKRLIIDYISDFPTIKYKTCDSCKKESDAGSTLFLCESCGADGSFPTTEPKLPTVEQLEKVQ